MKNFIQKGDTVTVPAPAAVTSGQIVVVGGLVGVAQYAAAIGEAVEIERVGVFELPKTSAQAWTVGAKLYWDAAASAVTTTVGSNLLIGAAAAAAANPSATGRVLLDGVIR